MGQNRFARRITYSDAMRYDGGRTRVVRKKNENSAIEMVDI